MYLRNDHLIVTESAKLLVRVELNLKEEGQPDCASIDYEARQ